MNGNENRYAGMGEWEWVNMAKFPNRTADTEEQPPPLKNNRIEKFKLCDLDEENNPVRNELAELKVDNTNIFDF